MCAVSAVYDYGRQHGTATWTPYNWEQYNELIRKAAEYDRLTNQPHCEDPGKVEWMKEIEERLAKLEGVGG